jgi:small-conductance mechanosensitive channel
MKWLSIAEEIANFPEILNFILGGIFVILVFALAYAYLKPHQLHKRRLLSTLMLKVTYLLYLLVLLIVIYFSTLVRDGLVNVFFGVEFFAFLIVLFVPNIGILARKLGYFSKKRESYNWFFTVVNLLSAIALLLMFFI